jgi:hypothetical protein
MAQSWAAQSWTVQGYVDARVVAPASEKSWIDGGLGKTRFGDGAATGFGGALAAHVQLAPAWLASAQVQVLPDQRHRLDILDASLRYRPVSTTPWRWSVRAGAFFPPISLENNGVGWTSPWTLSPSAIDTWVGEELRTIGGEMRLEHRGQAQTVELLGAVYTRNDPAGELLATRGWALGDFTSGLNASLREPDVLSGAVGAAPPILYQPFVEIDNRIGWYAGLNWSAPAYGKLSLLRYDNRADPTRETDYAGREVYAWHTRFWSLGLQGNVGDVTVLAQAMHGATAFEPVPGLLLDTRFNAGYLLAAWGQGRWRPALRVDLFQARQLPDFLSDPLSEHGNALTAALNWQPREHLRVTGEWMRVDSTRDQRLLEGGPARRIDIQLQVNTRLQF